NRRVFKPSLRSEEESDQYQGVYLMDSPIMTPGSVRSSNDENPRVKFLCSFNGSILPRPQDGKLRYVGGETRIVSVPGEIGYEELMGRMRELFEGATLLKYQQPDEDLDALVSVVNDDDVTNMMEEYDKSGSGDGFTRLRIFLFPHGEQDGSVHFVDGDERDNERRYVDALNSLNESPDLRKQQPGESQLDDIHTAAQYFNQMSLDTGVHNQRNLEIPMPPNNLRHLTIPHMGSGQNQQSVTQRYNEIEASWSPVYCSPRHPGHHDPRPAAEFSTSPSSAHYCMAYAEFSEKNSDRVSEEYSRQQVNHQFPYDQQPQLTDNVVWVPTGSVSGDKAGFPGNILHGSNIFEGNSSCEHCRVAYHRNQAYPDSPWRRCEQPHLELPNMGNGLHHVNHCAECPPSRETFMLPTDARMPHPFYPREQNDPRLLYAEVQNQERGWVLQHQSNPRADEPRPRISGAGRLNDHYIIDGNGMNYALGHGSLPDGHQMSLPYAHHEDHSRYVRAGSELGNEVYHDPAVATGSSHIHIPIEERGVRYGNIPCAYGGENLFQVAHGHVPAHVFWRNVHNPIPGAAPYEASSSPQLANGTCSPGYIRGTLDGSPRIQVGLANNNPWVESSQKMSGLDGSATPEFCLGQTLKAMPDNYNLENQQLVSPDPIQAPRDVLNNATPMDSVSRMTTSGAESTNCVTVTESVRMEEKHDLRRAEETNYEVKVDASNMICMSVPEQIAYPCNLAFSEAINEISEIDKAAEDKAPTTPGNKELQVDRFSFLPELLESVKKAAIEGFHAVKGEGQEGPDPASVHDDIVRETTLNVSEVLDAHGDLELDSENDNRSNSKIEPTKAEAEAIARGLQTIKNDDLEEIRELGSGTYGAVFHGKWKGSDVAIKRIKASCFAGRPSERARLIADFWKEALILSSLHHPNVVSFYGIVRDGPDGSLATVTEFMVNGSLKQFIQKKDSDIIVLMDRTIDRRKRLIIAMDAAFGMEYLHGKNIVHFDLKCENLLVNMRDPHRPVCKAFFLFWKIGDLGLSKVKQHTLVSGGVRGTLPWMAPELLSGKSNMVTEKIDVYSFGIVMWELLTGDEPYADMHCASIIGGIVNNTLRPQIPTWCDPEWKSLMESCWASDPGQRPSFSEISQRLRNMAAAINVK
ncbi:hypothetical protein RJ639_010936, partial [Escallonia herrerae]